MTALSRNLTRFARRVIREDCRLMVLGDSIWTREAAQRMPGGLVRTWPVNCVGRVTVSRATTSEAGGQAFNNSVLGSTVTHRLPGDTLTNSDINRTPVQIIDRQYSGNVANGQALERRIVRGPSHTYPPGTVDPADGHALKARVLWLRTANTVPVHSLRYRRGTSGGYTIVDHNTDLATGDPGIAWTEFDMPAASGDAEVAWLTTPDADETGYEFLPMEAFIYRPDVPGFVFSPIAQGGWTTRHHLDPAVDSTNGRYDDAHLVQYYEALRSPNALMVQLGQNMASGESSGGVAQEAYRDNIEAVVERHLTAMAMAGSFDVPVCLISPYQGTSDPTRYEGMADLLDQLAADRGWGFINLFQTVNDEHGEYETWQGVLTSDGVHPTASGADTFASLVWMHLSSATRSAAGLNTFGLDNSFGL